MTMHYLNGNVPIVDTNAVIDCTEVAHTEMRKCKIASEKAAAFSFSASIEGSCLNRIVVFGYQFRKALILFILGDVC